MKIFAVSPFAPDDWQFSYSLCESFISFRHNITNVDAFMTLCHIDLAGWKIFCNDDIYTSIFTSIERNSNICI